MKKEDTKDLELFFVWGNVTEDLFESSLALLIRLLRQSARLFSIMNIKVHIIILFMYRKYLNFKLEDFALELINLNRVAVELDPHVRARLIDQINRLKTIFMNKLKLLLIWIYYGKCTLIGKESSANIAVAELGSGNQSRIGNSNSMVRLIALLAYHNL